MSKRFKTLNIKINTLSHELRGIGESDGKKVFVRGALPEEIVVTEVRKNKSKMLEGVVKSLENPSEDRITPFCKKADMLVQDHVCGGCSLQHITQEKQLFYKKKIVSEIMKIDSDDSRWLDTMYGSDRGYRTKARLGVRFNKKLDKVHVGFREAQSSFIADMDSCPILSPCVGDKLVDIATAIKKFSKPDTIPQIEVAVGEEKTALIFRHLKELEQEDLDILKKLAVEHNWHIFLQSGGPDTVKLKFSPNSDTTSLLSYTLPALDLKLNFHPTEFTQVNIEVNRKIINRVLDGLKITKEDVVFDLFCGIGNFSVALAKFAKKVVCAEGIKSLTNQCENNAKINNLDNIETYNLDLYSDGNLQDLDELFKKHKPSVVLLDPPRSGCLQVCELISKYDFVDRMYYVSCNPATLARDTEFLCNNGAQMQSISIADMFTNTSHIETMALFTFNK
jgi:23S rRNA (uracil1939-C5)-methyltransferase